MHLIGSPSVFAGSLFTDYPNAKHSKWQPRITLIYVHLMMQHVWSTIRSLDNLAVINKPSTGRDPRDDSEQYRRFVCTNYVSRMSKFKLYLFVALISFAIFFIWLIKRYDSWKLYAKPVCLGCPTTMTTCPALVTFYLCSPLSTGY